MSDKAAIDFDCNTGRVSVTTELGEASRSSLIAEILIREIYELMALDYAELNVRRLSITH